MKVGLARLLILLSLILYTAWPSSALEAGTTDFLVQMVCVNGSNQPIYGDPYTCPNARRKLAISEPLPYHKVDLNTTGNVQISDPYPISDINGINRAVQTYYYKAGLPDSAFASGNVFFQYNGGYNVIGADTSYVFFAGTWDGNAGWQPWWKSSCQPRGWVLFPNQSGTLSYGGTNSGAGNTPKCVTSKINTTANVEWNSGNVTYDGGSGTPKSIFTLYDFNFCNSTYDCMEANFFTEIYGATRFEKWCRAGTTNCAGPANAARDNCLHAITSATIHGNTMYMQDCRDWAQIDAAPPSPWNPWGTADYVPNVLTWGIDPLYNSANLLQNTHFGTGMGYNSSACDITNWSRVSTSPATNWAWDASAITPMQGTNNYNCALQFSVPGTPSGNAVFQQVSIPAGRSGIYSFGLQLWTPSGVGSVYVKVIGYNASGGLTDNAAFSAVTIPIPRTFGGSFNINPSTTTLVFALYPQNANLAYDFSGAWIAKTP